MGRNGAEPGGASADVLDTAVSSIAELIRRAAARSPDAPAILAVDRPPLSYGELLQQAERIGAALYAAGIGRNDRVALVLPDGPEAAVAFLSVAASATAAPLNPAYRSDELAFYLGDLRPKAVVVPAGVVGAVETVAEDLGIAVLRLASVAGTPAGIFRLDARAGRPVESRGWASPEDVALVLHTSGTTSRPKIVPLTQRNACASAQGVAASLELREADRCLNAMPLFHVHGLVGALLSSLAAGASVVCPPGFDSTRFLDDLDRFRATWYSAVPTIHRTVLARHAIAAQRSSPRSLRFIRSCSAPLPTRLWSDLERAFGVPVVEAYGMTEASHQIASNPLPPRERRPGSVGLPAGAEVAVVDESGAMLPRGATGEIVVRGAGVTAGYEDNPTANAAAFVDGWFRTGDQGFVDADGYVHLTGRLKELINRAGEKVAPGEVDEALMRHPAVAQALAFALPDERLGEDVAAAVVLEDDGRVDPAELRAFVAGRLAPFKVPRVIAIVDALPRGPTGKPRRIGLAGALGLVESAASSPVAAPGARSDDLEQRLLRIWEEVLALPRIGVDGGFFELGGDSLGAARLVARIEQELGVALDPSVLAEAPTVERLAAVLRGGERSSATRSLVAIQPGGSRRPFFGVHALFGGVTSYARLAPYLGSDQPLYALRAPGLDDGSEPYGRVADLAARYVEEIRAVQPAGPYLLGGLCFGGVVAFEMARQLDVMGEPVALLAVFDGPAPGSDYTRVRLDALLLRDLARNLPSWLAEGVHLGSSEWVELLRLKARVAQGRLRSKRWPGGERRDGGVRESVKALGDLLGLPERSRLIAEAHDRALRAYVPAAYPGRLVLFRARMQPLVCSHALDMGWSALARGGVEVRAVPGNHLAMLQEPRIRAFATQLRSALDRAQQSLA